MPLSQSDLDGMQALAADLLPDTAAITRTQTTRDSSGGVKTASTTNVATVPCRVTVRSQDGSAREDVHAERPTSRVEWILTVPAGTDLRASDRVTVGSRVFEVTGLLAGSYEAHRRAVCQEQL